MRFAIFLLAIFSSLELFPIVRILTFHYNQPNFVELQYKTFKKFLSDDFEMIVFNDAPIREDAQEIEEVCNEYGIQCVHFEQKWHFTDPLNDYLQNCLQKRSIPGLWGWTSETSVETFAQHPSVRHCHVIQYALDHFGYDHDDLVVISDGDNFLVQPMSFRELLGANDLVGCTRQPDYLKRSLGQPLTRALAENSFWEVWVVFIVFNPNKLPTPRELHFHVDVVSKHPKLPDDTVVDSGGAVYKYINMYPHLKIEEFFSHRGRDLRLFCDDQAVSGNMFYYYLIQLIDEIYPQNIFVMANEHFLHFGSVSFEMPGHLKKSIYFEQFIHHILED